ncbi:MAG: hypothetical protein Q9208_002905 [Pyrenodesmia sp. 3 TL-2023]
MHFTSLTHLVLAALAVTSTPVSATRLFASSYAGTITTLDLSKVGNDSYYLAKLDTNNGCSPNASWIEIDVKRRNLFCLDEGMVTGNGSLTSFKIKNDDTGKTLTQISHTIIPNAPVNSALFTGSNGTQLLAVAHYAYALTTWKVDPKTAFYTGSQYFNFTMLKPGANAARQAAPHPHQVIVDPTNAYLVVPDLGADLIRVFYIDPKTLQVTPRPSIPVPPGSGPRHGVFHTSKKADGTTSYHYFLVSELTSTISGYSVAYLPNNGGITLAPLGSGKTYGSLTDAVFSGNAPAEVVLAPLSSGDVQLVVSNRNATFYKDIPNPDPKNQTKIVSDTLASFTLPKASDSSKALMYRGLSPAGGLFPRHFSINKKGDLVAVGLQNSGRVVIYERCLHSGKIGDKVVAGIEGLGAVTSVVWDEGEAADVAKGVSGAKGTDIRITPKEPAPKQGGVAGAPAPPAVPGAAALASAAAALASAAPAPPAPPAKSTGITITLPKETPKPAAPSATPPSPAPAPPPKEAPKAPAAPAAPPAPAAPGKEPIVSITV